MANADPMPEGTDTIINDDEAQFDTPPSNGAGAKDGSSAGSGQGGGGGNAGGSGDARAKIADAAAKLRGQATDKAFAFADQGKERATTALDDLAKMVEEIAGQVEEKVGPEYGDYARRAAGAVSGLAGTIRDKDVTELVDDARTLVRNSPAVAIGAAAAIGFVVARLARAAAPAPAPAGDDGDKDA